MLNIYVKSKGHKKDLFADFEICFFESLRQPFMDSLPSLVNQRLIDLDKSIELYVKTLVRMLLDDKEMNKAATNIDRVSFCLQPVSSGQRYSYSITMSKYFFLPKDHQYNMLSDDVYVSFECDEDAIEDISIHTQKRLGFELRDILTRNYESNVLLFIDNLYDTVNMWYKLSCKQKISKEADDIFSKVADGVMDYAYKHEGHAPSDDYIMSLFHEAVEEQHDHFQKKHFVILRCF